MKLLILEAGPIYHQHNYIALPSFLWPVGPIYFYQIINHYSGSWQIYFNHKYDAGVSCEHDSSAMGLI